MQHIKNIEDVEIVTLNGAPIVVTTDVIDFWLIAKASSPDLEGDDRTFNEYMRHTTIKGQKAKDFLMEHGVKLWYWNKIAGTFYERT